MTNLLETFEMKIEQKEDGKVVVSMPVTDKVKQPFGYLHGGASLALGETACSIGAAHLIDTQQFTRFRNECKSYSLNSTRTCESICFFNTSRKNNTSLEY